MSERIFEEVAVVIKQKYTVRFLEYKERGSEFTEINVYCNETTEKDEDLSENFSFGFTVKGRADKEKEKIEMMTEGQFEEFIKHMSHIIENKYHVVHQKETKKDEKPVVKEPDDKSTVELT